MKVKDCMCHQACCMKPDEKIAQAAKIMCQNHIGCVPVCNEKNELVGIVTDRDLILRCMACDKDASSEPVSNIMTCNVCSCMQNDEVEEAKNKMDQFQVRRLPVVENGKVIGMLTLGDLAQNEQIDPSCLGKIVENICCNGNKNAE